MFVRRKRFTLMPLIALASLSLAVSLPTLASGHLYAASPQRYTTVIVKPGDDLSTLAAAHTSATGDVQTTTDRVLSYRGDAASRESGSFCLDLVAIRFLNNLDHFGQLFCPIPCIARFPHDLP